MDLGLTLAQVAEASGLSIGYVSNIEKGRGNPTLSSLEAVAGALRLSLASLFAPADPQAADIADAARSTIEEPPPEGAVDGGERAAGEVSSSGPMGWAAGVMTPAWMRLTRDDLLAWADTEGSDRRLPALVDKLIKETTPEGTRSFFRSGRGVLSGGWDGLVDCPSSHPFVPAGRSGWEVSVEKNTKRKSESDYVNRCDTVQEQDRKEMAYVQVICRQWTKADEFEATKTASGDFRETYALNVDHLEAWLAYALQTTVWLREVMDKPVKGIEPLAVWWRRWLDSTSRRVDAGVVLAGRENAADELRRLCDGGGTVTVTAEAPHEAIVAFIAAALADGADGAEPLYVESLNAARRLLAAAGRPTTGAGSILVVESADLADRLAPVPPQCVVVPVPGSQQADVVVGPVDAREVSERLRAHGIDHEKAWDLGYLGRRSLLALRRELAVKRELHRPSWAADIDGMARRCLLLNRWDGRTPGDVEIVERYVGKPYSDVQERLEGFGGDDPPMLRFGAVWHAVSSPEVWLIAGRSLKDEELEQLAEVAVEVLVEPDPLFGLDMMAHIEAASEGVGPRYSERLKRGLATSLAVLATAEDQVPAGVRFVVEDAVRRLLELANNDASLKRWATVAPWLPLLAEAAPRAVLAAIRVSLADGAPLASAMESCQQKDSFEVAFGSPQVLPPRHLLDTLEVLSWSPEYLGEAALMLVRLDEMGAGDGFGHSPTGVLSGIMCPWMPNTAASAESRFAVLDLLRREHPELAWQVMLSMLPNAPDATSSDAAPRYRDWKDQRVPVTNAECFEVEERAGTALIADAASIEGGWAQLVERCGNMWLNTRAELIDALGDVARRADEPTRKTIWPAMREMVARHREFSDTEWALPASELEPFESLLGLLRPTSFAELHGWLFDQSVPDFEGASRRTEDSDTREVVIAARRVEAVREILASGGLDAVIAFAGSVEAPGLVGEALAHAAPEDLDAPIMRHLDGSDPAAAARGYFRARFQAGGWELFDALIASHDPGPTATVELLRTSWDPAAVWARVDASEAELVAEYWQRFTRWDLGHHGDLAVEAAQRLTSAGRVDTAAAALAGFDHHLRDDPQYAQAVAEVLEELANQRRAGIACTELKHPRLGVLMKALDRHVETLGAPRVARIEWEHLPDLRRSAQTPNLHKALVDSPEFFASIVQEAYPTSEPSDSATEPGEARSRYRRSAARRLLRQLHQSPGLDSTGHLNPEQLRDWVTRARQHLDAKGISARGDLVVGAVLAKAPPDPDGHWPAAAVCELIEEIASDDLDSGLIDATITGRGGGTTSPWGGAFNESELAAKYRHTSKRLAARLHQRAAAICGQLADFYEQYAIMRDRRTTERQLGLDT